MLYIFTTITCLALSLGVTPREARDLAPRGELNRKILRSRALLFTIFTVLFLVQALRINVGNDYAKYVEFMHLARFGGYVPTEPGFNLLSWLTYRLFGYENFIFCFAVMAAVTIASFVAAIRRLSIDFTGSFFCFMLLGYYFQSISTVRYYLALGVVLLSLSYMLKRDYPMFVLCVLFASLFHKSALLAIVLYPFAALNWSAGALALMTVGGAACFFLKEKILQLALVVYSTYRETSYAAGGEGSKASIARVALVILLAYIADRGSFVYRGEDASINLDGRARRFYCHANILALMVYVFFSYLPIISRIGYYLTITQIIYVPILIERLQEDKNLVGWARKMPAKTRQRAAMALTCGFLVVTFVHTMSHAGDDGFRILPYQTFFFHDMPAILSDKGY